MQRMKSFIASMLVAFIMFVGLGLGVMAVGLAIVLGGALALALKLSGPHLNAKFESRPADFDEQATHEEPATA